MKLIHITAAYKPAYIYGGPTMSVAKLCECLVAQGIMNKEKGEKSKEQGLRIKEHRISSSDEGKKCHDYNEVTVFTTTANGKDELAVVPGEIQQVDGVQVTYFKRVTKDHTHFSPALLWNFRKMLRQTQNEEQGARNTEQRIKSKKQEAGNDNEESNREILREAQNDKKVVVHIHAWWNLVSILSCWLAKFYNVPVVLSPRGMLTDYTLGNRNAGFKSIIHTLIGKWLLRYCHIHATSEKEKNDVLRFIRPKSVTVIANLVDLGLGSKEQSIKNEDQRSKDKEQGLKYEDPRAKTKELGVQNEDQRSKSKEHGLKNQEQREKNEDRRAEYKELVVQKEDQRVKTKDQGLKSKDQRPENNEQGVKNSESRPFKMIFLSRIEEKKGLALLFEALADLKIDWSLTIAGSGEEDYVKSLKLKVESLKFNERINWIGQVTNDNKFKLLAAHDLMVLTSYNENFANVVIESLSVGTPALLSNEVGLSDYVIANNLGWVSSLRTESISEI